MGIPQSTLAYADVRKILNEALESPRGLRFPVDSQQEATKMVFRLNSCRQTDRKQNKRIYPGDHPKHGCSDWDGLSFNKVEEKSQWYVYVRKIEAIEIANLEQL